MASGRRGPVRLLLTLRTLSLSPQDGEVPYGFGVTNKEMVDLVLRKVLLRRPPEDKMPDQIWDIVKDCFKFDEDERPGFKEIQVRYSSLRVYGVGIDILA